MLRGPLKAAPFQTLFIHFKQWFDRSNQWRQSVQAQPVRSLESRTTAKNEQRQTPKSHVYQEISSRWTIMRGLEEASRKSDWNDEFRLARPQRVSESHFWDCRQSLSPFTSKLAGEGIFFFVLFYTRVHPCKIGLWQRSHREQTQVVFCFFCFFCNRWWGASRWKCN